MGNKLNIDENNEYDGRGKYVHNCRLPRESEVISYFVPDQAIFRQWFRKMCLISSNVAHRRLFVKSFRALEQDRAIHLTQHYYMIHPFSPFRFYWEVFMILIFLIQLIVVPFIMFTKDELFISLGIYVVEILQLIGLINIVIQFVSGYYEKTTRDIILDPKKIVKHYLKTLFIWDFLANIPLELIFIYFIRMKHLCITVRGIMLLGFLNIVSFMHYTNRFREKRQYPMCIYRLMQFIFVYCIVKIWLMACLGIAIYLDQHDLFSVDLWWLLSNNLFTLISSSGETAFILHGCELKIYFIAIKFGFIMRTIITAQIILIFKSHYSSKRKYSQLLSELRQFSHFKRLPRDIKDRIFDYYQFVFQRYYYNESEIWNLMSDKLKYEIEKNLYKVWFEADIFKFCPPQLTQSFVLLLKKEIYLSNDVVFLCNSVANYIYFLKCGTIALYDKNEKEVFHVQEGCFFSDSAVILEKETAHEFTAIAIESCEVYKLHREDFREVIQHFPEEYNVMLRILQKRREYIEKHSNSLINLSNYYKAYDLTGEEGDQDKKQKKKD